MTPQELAESLRAMARHAVPHYSPAGCLPRVAVVMETWRLEHLVHAADALVAPDQPDNQPDTGPDTEGYGL